VTTSDGPGAGDGLAWPLDRSEQAGDFRHFRVRRDWYRSPRDGEPHDFYVLDMPDWVQVVALTTEGRLVLVEQFRPGTRVVTLEFPAGLVDPGEEPAAAAARELAEETGYRGGEATIIAALAPNPALQNNRLFVVLIEGCQATGERDQDTGEAIRVRDARPEEIDSLILAERFDTAYGLVAWECYRRHEQQLHNGTTAQQHNSTTATRPLTPDP
jgi:ADP-ribose pyrophosphatase